MADKKTIDTDMAKLWHHRYYLELARLSTGMLVGVMALMTFLLTVGLQHPQKPFAPVFYTTVSLLAFGLICYVVGHMLHQRLANLTEAGAAEGKLKTATMMVRVVRGLQQAAFILSILAILALILVSAHIFFAVPAAPSSGGQ